MPRGDGTGPNGTGPMGGGGSRRGGGGMGGGGRGRGFAGPGGECICTKCNKTVVHERGVPCSSMKCPDCGAPMTRKM